MGVEQYIFSTGGF